MDVFQLGSTLWITIANLPHGGSESVETHRVIAAFSVLIIWFKLFDWLRLFESTAFYIELLFKTLKDIRVFIIIFLVALAMFGSSMFFLQCNATVILDLGDNLVDSFFNFFLIDMVLNQYLLSLGDFKFTSYENHPQWYLCWFFLLTATFFTQITMLNMLIAIMGNTFDCVIEKKASFVMKSQLQTMSEYSNVINKYYVGSHNFLFIVKQMVTEEGMDDNNCWEGGFTHLKKSMIKRMDETQEQLKAEQSLQVAKLVDQIRQASEKNSEDSRGLM